MANLNFSFAFKGGQFCLCCTVKGTTTRHYKEVSGSYQLISPNFDYWDRKEQKFLEPTQEAITNNQHLEAMKAHYESLYNTLSLTRDIPNGKVLFALENEAAKIVAERHLTFGDFVRQLIQHGKTESVKKPSKNYQKYITLLHKLEKQGTIINKPLKDVCNSDFREFGEFILGNLTSKEGKNNYTNLMKLFKAVIRQANVLELNDTFLSYPYGDYAPTRKSKERVALTKEQYQKFCRMDLTTIPQGGINPMFYKELYRDFCVFLYEMKMRPCDVVRLHSGDIHEGKYITYVAEKKKNIRNERKRTTLVEMTETAKKIVRKYSGKSAKGYVFPFALNNYDWDFDNADSWNKWSNRKQKQQEDINVFLHKCEAALGVKGITLYTFRHSTFTHAVNEKGSNLMKIAREGATSVKMLEDHYYHLQTAI